MNIGRRNKIKAEGGMSSMTDLVFLLLIFFIIMATRSKQEMPVDLPSSSVPVENEDLQPLNVAVTADNMYILDDDMSKMYSFDEVVPIIEGRMAESIGKGIKIYGDKTADYESVFNLLALSKQKDWKPVLVFK